ncbi:hypothetical protein PpBr36_04170, partial [Pyricularia pennisetigena]|uniref:hypothetical protein n=1 Tax=Pyricularia pennisetigena TaxID=1578925 RepID=UPI00114F2BB9
GVRLLARLADGPARRSLLRCPGPLGQVLLHEAAVVLLGVWLKQLPPQAALARGRQAQVVQQQVPVGELVEDHIGEGPAVAERGAALRPALQQRRVLEDGLGGPRRPVQVRVVERVAEQVRRRPEALHLEPRQVAQVVVDADEGERPVARRREAGRGDAAVKAPGAVRDPVVRGPELVEGGASRRGFFAAAATAALREPCPELGVAGRVEPAPVELLRLAERDGGHAQARVCALGREVYGWLGPVPGRGYYGVYLELLTAGEVHFVVGKVGYVVPVDPDLSGIYKLVNAQVVVVDAGCCSVPGNKYNVFCTAVVKCISFQNLPLTNLPAAVPCTASRSQPTPEKSSNAQGDMKDMNRTLASLSLTSLNGPILAQDGMIHDGPRPVSRMTQSTWWPVTHAR